MPFTELIHNKFIGKDILPPYRGPPLEAPSSDLIASFHRSLPNFKPTPLIPHPELASSIGVAHVFVKSETNRLGLPAFKILGASYATYRHLRRILDVPDDDTTTLEQLGEAAQKRDISLTAATDGNHGRAVARMAGILGIKATIFVPTWVHQYTCTQITNEGPHVQLVHVEGSYDDAVDQALHLSKINDSVILIQDNSIPELNDDSIANWIVGGYTTILHEIDEVLALHKLKPDLVVVPVGVGSLAQAVVMHYKPDSTESTTGRPKIMTVEPVAAPCLARSVEKGEPTSVETEETIMAGLCCGTVSALAFPYLLKAVDYCAVMDDKEAHKGVLDLNKIGIDAGPIPGGCIAAVRSINPSEFGLDENSTIVVLATEGAREYEVPV